MNNSNYAGQQPSYNNSQQQPTAITNYKESEAIKKERKKQQHHQRPLKKTQKINTTVNANKNTTKLQHQQQHLLKLEFPAQYKNFVCGTKAVLKQSLYLVFDFENKSQNGLS